MCVRESAGLALLAFCLIAGQSEVAGVSTCSDLISGIIDGVIELEESFTCPEGITIETGIDVTINGSGYGITLDPAFTGTDSNDALFYNQGTLTLTDLTIKPLEEDIYIRGVYNEGELTITGSSFEGLNIGDGEALADGGAIYSDSTSSVTIEGSSFTSNVAGSQGGAIYAIGTETLTISDSDFSNNEAGITEGVYGSGGDIYAVDGVTLNVARSTFLYSATDIGGASIECCGGTINDCDFVGAESNSDNDEHYGGALLVGRPDYGGCSNELVVSNSNFTSCSVNYDTGAGGSIAIFDTDASITDCVFERNAGTAVLFQTSSSHSIKVESSEFNENFDPAVAYADNEVSQASAFVIQYTGEDDDTSPVASFDTIYCFANDPYECEFVYDGATVVSNGEFKCQICSLDGDRLFIDADDELFESDDTGDESSSSKDSNTGIVIGLSLALGVTLVVIGALAVWKVRVRNNARRLMEDMGDNDI